MRPASLLAWILMALAFGASPSAADFRKSYVDGYKAFKKERWLEVERFMEAAIAENPSDGSTVIVISGEFRQTYIPHYYLALARAKLGRCEEALADWTTFGTASGVRELSEFSSLAAQRRTCTVQVAASKSLTIERELAAVEQRLTDIQGRPERRQLVDAWNSEAGLGSAETQLLESVKRHGRDLAEARTRADLDELELISEDIRRLTPRVEELERSMVRMATERGAPIVAPSEIQVEATPTRIEGTVRAVRPSRELVRLAEMFFAGNYEQSLAIASEVEPRSEAERIQLWLFEAAAHYALSSLEPAAARNHIATATLQVKAVKRANPRFQPSAKYFFPGFIRFWSQIS